MISLRRGTVLLRLLATLAFAWGVATVVTGGFDLRVPGFVLRSHSPARGFAVSFLALAVLAIVQRRPFGSADGGSSRGECPPAGPSRAAWWVGVASAAFALVVGIHYGSFAAGGADSYGYVSQANLIAQGRLSVMQPIASEVPWPDADWTLTPLGFTPGRVPGTIVPAYPPGLPLVMAAARVLGGARAVFFVVPILGVLAVWLTFLIGARLGGLASGAVAATLLAASPIFLYQLVQPMSDVPVVAWVLAAIVLAGRRTTMSAVGAGLCAALALLTRPNTVLVVAPIVVYLLAGSRSGGSRWRLPALFAAGVVPGLVALALLQWAAYGSPLRSGYAPLGTLFRLEHVLPNLASYPAWLLESETPVLALAVLAPAVVWRRRRSPAAAGDAWALAWLCLSVAAIVFVTYLFFTPFDNWSFLRYLLPALPLLIAPAAAVVVAAIRRLRLVSPGPTVAIVCGLLVWLSLGSARTHEVFLVKQLERKYPETGAWVARNLPPNATILTLQQSGSIRLYSGRLTLRWDLLSPDWLDRAVTFLEKRGDDPYFLIERAEEESFRARFAGRSRYAMLDWRPIAQLGVVRIYDPRQAGR